MEVNEVLKEVEFCLKNLTNLKTSEFFVLLSQLASAKGSALPLYDTNNNGFGKNNTTLPKTKRPNMNSSCKTAVSSLLGDTCYI